LLLLLPFAAAETHAVKPGIRAGSLPLERLTEITGGRRGADDDRSRANAGLQGSARRLRAPNHQPRWQVASRPAGASAPRPAFETTGGRQVPPGQVAFLIQWERPQCPINSRWVATPISGSLPDGRRGRFLFRPLSSPPMIAPAPIAGVASAAVVAPAASACTTSAGAASATAANHAASFRGRARPHPQGPAASPSSRSSHADAGKWLMATVTSFFSLATDRRPAPRFRLGGPWAFR